MPVPILDTKRQYSDYQEEVEREIIEVARSGWYIGGPKLASFEENVGKYCESKFAIGVSSGTDALLAALMALDIKAGDEVITTTFSFFATIGVIARVGATPVLCDIDIETFNIDPAQIEAKITEKTKAIIPVHLYGQCADMDEIMKIAKKHNLYVIEDGAQAIGSKRFGTVCGNFGDFGCFSFYPTKNLGAMGEGGLVTTNNEELAHKMGLIRNHGMEPKYYHKFIGGNFRLDAMQAAVLDVKLKYLDKWTEGRQKNAALYRKLFAEKNLIGKIALPVEKEGRHIYNQFTLLCEKRDELFKFMQENKIGCDMYYPLSFHEQECFQYLGCNKEEFPVANKATQECLSIPIFPELTEEEIVEVVETIAKFYS